MLAKMAGFGLVSNLSFESFPCGFDLEGIALAAVADFLVFEDSVAADSAE